jgi:Asp/Glu/hydantoin racemase
MVLIMGVWISVTGIGKEPIVRSLRVAVITTSSNSRTLVESSCARNGITHPMHETKATNRSKYLNTGANM